MKCAYHDDREAVAVCVSCGAGLCPDCRTREGGKYYCDECAKTHEPIRVWPERAGGGLNVWSVCAWVLAMVGLWPGLEFLAIAGLVLGFVALGDIKARGYTQTGRAYAIAAVVIALTGLVVKFGLMFYSLYDVFQMSPWLNPFRYVQ